MTGRAGDQVTTTSTADNTTSSAAVVKEPDSKKVSGSGPVSITMDVYQQLQQKRLLERQQQESLKQQQQKQQHGQGQGQEAASISYYQGAQSVVAQPYDPSGTQPLETLEQIVSIVQATATALPMVTSQPQQLQMPGPDLANLIFGTAPPAVAPALSVGTINAATATSASTTSNGHSNSTSNSSHQQHRKGTGASSGSQMQSQSQQPRTSSPPTPASGSSSGAQKSSAVKGPKAIHAIELIRIAGEILQFPPTTIGTSLVYYHKYRAYLHQAYKRGERDNEAFRADEYLFATACLHLACKCTEVSRKVRDLVNVTYRVMNPGQPALSLSTKVNDDSNQPSSSQQQQHTIAPPPTAATYWHIRDSLLTTELMLLRILQFDLDVSLPFSDVLRIYKGMGMVFSPTDEEAAQLYPHASNFDVFLPAAGKQQQQQHLHQASHSSSSSPSKHGTPTLPPSTSSGAPSMSNAVPHTGIHPTLSALVQISTTFCIDALCSSNIALNSSSRALAMGSIYLAIRSAGLDLPLPFEEWCYAWGRPMIATGFGIQVAGSSGPGVGMGAPGVGAGVVSGVNGIMGLTGGTNNLFVSSPRPTSDSSSFMEGLELSGASGSGSSTSGGGGGAGNGGGVGGGSGGGLNGSLGRDPVYSQTHSPQVNSNTQSQSSPSVRGSQDSLQQQQQDSGVPQQPMTIVDEVRKVVQELGSFYTH
ncbi:hypothetical protein BGX29_009219 [Mortierella sp. GBA35]|nr:hypothetical protein BGX29_009219 [Mortierella sp. GBA35]